MNSPDQDWWIAQSGEFVLGTLSSADWATFAKAAQHNEEAQRLIAEWEETFQPLADALEPVTPPHHVWAGIQARLSGEPAEHGIDTDEFDLYETTDSQYDDSVASLLDQRRINKSLERKAGLWRSFAGLATAASILLASFLWINHLEVRDQAPVESVVALTQCNSMTIVRDEQALPIWIVDAAMDEGLVRVTAIAPPPIEDSQVYELWMVKPDESGVQSMAVAFAVSLEPAGGSPQDVPTGPVLFQGVVQNLEI